MSLERPEPFKLVWKYSQLYRKRYYLTSVTSVINRITEYDLKNAGFSAIKEGSLLSEKKIERLGMMEKRRLNVAIGDMQRTNKVLLKKIPEYIEKARHDLFKSNLVHDYEVVSIKNDAVFISGRRLKNLEFGEMKFVPKNEYSSFHQYNGIEYYYSKRQERLDIKGINDIIAEAHEEGIITFLKTVFGHIEMGNTRKLRQYLVTFSNAYKSRTLPVIYYREFNHENIYRFTFGSGDFFLQLTEASSDMVNDLDITFNYKFFVLPLLQKYLF